MKTKYDILRILTCEDDEDCLTILKRILTQEGYSVIQAVTGQEALTKIKRSNPDLVILDINLPDANGVELCKLLKKNSQTSHIPIIMLTVRSSDTDIVLGLESGADDYIPKPINPKILLARIRALLRRTIDESGEKTNFACGLISIDLAARRCFINKKEVELRPKEFDLLAFLMRHQNKVVSREKIAEAVWEHEQLASSRTIDSTIYNIRKALKQQGKQIKSVNPYGYRLERLK